MKLGCWLKDHNWQAALRIPYEWPWRWCSNFTFRGLLCDCEIFTKLRLKFYLAGRVTARPRPRRRRRTRCRGPRPSWRRSTRTAAPGTQTRTPRTSASTAPEPEQGENILWQTKNICSQSKNIYPPLRCTWGWARCRRWRGAGPWWWGWGWGRCSGRGAAVRGPSHPPQGWWQGPRVWIDI